MEARMVVLQGTYQEEAMAMEVFFDTVRVRIDRLQSQVREAERRWAAAGIPWDGSAFRRCRLASLHIATLFMSRWAPVAPQPAHCSEDMCSTVGSEEAMFHDAPLVRLLVG